MSRKDTLSKKQTWRTRRTSHARRISKSGDAMDQKCTEKPTEATGEWRIQDIEPICWWQGNNQGWRENRQGNCVIRRETSSTAPKWRQGIPGVATTTATSRRKYWVLKANKLSKAVKFKCVTCRKLAHENETQLMAELPPIRLAPQTQPFYYTACDYFGPFSVKVGRNKKAKHYGVIFTCLNTRAVHL